MHPKTLQWLSLVAIIWLQAVNGTNTNFPAYSSQFKHFLSISQLQLNNLAFASDAGKIFGFFSGIAALYLPLWLLLFIGSTLGLIGYGVQYLFIKNYIHSLSYGHIFLLSVLAGNSICWINTVCYTISIHNFPFDRQLAVGLTTSYQGLSAKIYTVLVDSFLSHVNKHGIRRNQQEAKAYLLLNSVLPLVVSVISAPLTKVIDDNDHGNCKSMKGGFVVMFVITIATGIYAVIGSLKAMSSKLPPLGNAIGILAFLLVPLVIPLSAKIKQVFLNKETKVYNFNTVDNVVGMERLENGVVKEDGRREIDDDYQLAVKEEIGVKLMLVRLDFWLYFFVYFCGPTLGLVYLNNLGQIAESRRYSGTSSLVSVSSSFGFFGRLLPSMMDYLFLRSRYFISKPASIAALMAPMAGAFFLLLSTTTLSLYISTAIIGVCTGAITSISVSTTTELFGTKNFSVNHNVVVANIPIGSCVFGYLAALLYKEGSGDGKCLVMQCYKNTFIIWGSLCSLGTFLALILYFRLQKFYSQRL